MTKIIRLNDMKIIYLIAGTYRPAGMERVLAGKTRWFAEHGYEVVVVTTDQRGRQPAFDFDPRIRMMDLAIGYEDNNGSSFFCKLLRYPVKQMRHKLRLASLLKSEKPEVTVSMFCNDAAFLPRIKDGSRKVLEIHFSRYKRLQYGRKGLWKYADRLRFVNDAKVASRFDRFVVLTEEDRGYWEEDASMPNIRVIPNARSFALPLREREGGKVVLAAGRYCYQKQFEKLVDAWTMCAQRCPGWVLRIVGDGEDRDFLEQRIAANGMQGRIVLGPAEDGMEREYQEASVFALCSRYEGLPMVLLEAQAASLPVVCFSCKCGPRDVITDGVDGFLVPEGDVRTLADRLLTLMEDDDMRREMGRAAYVNSDRFSEDRIMIQWERMFEELLSSQG